MATRLLRSPSTARHLPPARKPAFAGCVLSARELETVRQLARGLTPAQAAEERGCSASTVRSLLATAHRRLGVSTSAQAVIACNHAGWLDPVPDEGQAVAHADPRVTWAQRLYLEAFDQTLRAGDDPGELERTRVLREAALTGVFREANQARPWQVMATTHPLERIARTLQRWDAIAAQEAAAPPATSTSPSSGGTPPDLDVGT